MKKSVTIASLIVVLMLAFPFGAFAGLGGPYTVGIQIQNLSNVTANVVMSFYDQAGASVASPSVTIAAGSSSTFFPLSAVPSGFNGSLVVSSDQPVAAIANVIFPDGTGGASYSSFDAGAATVNLPLIMKNNFGIDTWFNVQNTATSDATVTVAYKPGSCTETRTVKPNSSQTFDQSVNTCLPNGFVGAATVTSGQPIVAIVMQIVRTSKALLAYNGFTNAATNPVMPLVTSNYFKSGTGIQLQNTGNTSTNVTVSYTPSAGFPGVACTEQKTIPAGQSVTYAFPNLPAVCGTKTGTGVTDPINGAFVGSAKVTVNSASMPLVAIVNQITRGTATSAAYDGVNPGDATSKVSLPLIMDRNFGIFTGFSVANVGTLPTNILCTFTGSAVTASANNVAPGAALTHVQLNALSSGYVGAANCTATGGDAKIAGIVNELKSGAAATTDALLVYDGFNY